MDALVDTLSRAAGPALQAWLARKGRVDALGRAAGRARLAAEVLQRVERTWGVKGYTDQEFHVEMTVSSGAFTRDRILAALPTVEAAGFRVRAQQHRWSAGFDWYVTASPERLTRMRVEAAEQEEREARQLEGAALPMPLGEPDPAALTLKHASVSSVAGELWVFPLVEHRVKSRPKDILKYEVGDLAYRLPKGTRLPGHYKRRKPPEWAVKLVEPREWGTARDFAVGPKGISARSLLEPFVPTADNRYGLTGYVWVGDQFAATDGNALHVVYVSESAPDAVRGVTHDQRAWNEPTMLTAKRYSSEGGFNLTPTRALSVGPFPDYHQVLPGRLPYRYPLDAAYMKQLSATMKAARAPRGELISLVVRPGAWALSWRDDDHKRQYLEVPAPKRQHYEGEPTAPLHIDVKLVIRALAAMRRIDDSSTWLERDARQLNPVVMSQTAGNPGRESQLSILMPMRVD